MLREVDGEVLGGFPQFRLLWIPSVPLENTKSPHPENPGKLLKNYKLAQPGTVLKITENLLRNYESTEKYLKTSGIFEIYSSFSAHFQDRSGGSQIVIFE